MPLSPGSRLGPYEILSAIGAGGMGEVYLAQDTRLHRRVALKVLPAALAIDESARRRLLHEARAGATLEHSNICALYDVGEADGHSFIAMQYVDGETLAARLKRGSFDLPTLVSVCRQVAEAVAEAHRRGIVHRDLKPQNIMLSAQNQVKVLDFGLAKATGRASVDVDTATVLTEQGAVAGTMPYMSPEQVRGEDVDERSDVFSFGTVAYEALTRTHPFMRASWAETVSAILATEPPIADIAAPAELKRILRKCLEKDRERRYQTTRDLAIDLENLSREISAPAAPPFVGMPAARPAGRRRTGIRIAAAAAAAVVGGAGAALFFSNTPRVPSVSDFEQLTDFSDSASAPSLSSDGQMVTFIRDRIGFLSGGQIYVKRLPNGDAVRVTNQSGRKLGPVFTPDGSHVAYTVVEAGTWSTWTVPISGGEPTRLLPNAASLSWIDGRHVLFSEIKEGSTSHMGLVTSTQDRADARQIYLPGHERGMVHYSYPAPDRSSVLVVEMGPTGDFLQCRLVPFDGSSSGRPVGPDGECRSAGWSPDGKWMYFSVIVGGVSHLWRQRSTSGPPEPITSGLATEEEGIAVAPDGQSIVTSLGRQQSAIWLHDASGERPLSSEGFAFAPRLSPAATRLYFLLRRVSTFATVELTVVDIASGKADRLLPDYSILDYAVSQDEQELAFTTAGAAGQLEIWIARLDRTSAPRRVVRGADSVEFAGHDLVFRSIEGQANYIDRITSDGKTRRRVSDLPIVTMYGASPDGRWAVARQARKGDRGARTVAMSTDGNTMKRLCTTACVLNWSPDQRWVYMRHGARGGSLSVLAVPVPPGGAFPEFPAGDADAFSAWPALPGARSFERADGVPGNDLSTYVFIKNDDRRNLFRVPLASR